MPREASKRCNWEKERRERFNKSFDELAKILPSYDPTVNISRNDVLKEAITTICTLKQEINKISNSTEDKTKFKDDLIKKLQERIKKLIIRNEQLVKLFKEAGIRLPKVISTAKFKKHTLWSNKISSEKQQKLLKKNQVEKENISSTCTQNRSKVPKLSSPDKNCTNSIQIKPPKPRKLNKKVTNNSLLLFSRLPTFNQHFLLVQNPPVFTRTSASVIPAQIKRPKSKKPVISAAAPRLNPALSTLGPGTLIFPNGNVLSVVSQPQIVVPSFPLKPPTIVNSNIPKISKATTNYNVDFKKNTSIRPKTCVTKTTQINKVPIPAFTSKYANTSLLLKDQITAGNKKVDKCEKEKNKVQTGIKRKIVEVGNNKQKIKKYSENEKGTTDGNTKNVPDTETPNSGNKELEKSLESVPNSTASPSETVPKSNELPSDITETIIKPSTSQNDNTSPDVASDTPVPQKEIIEEVEKPVENFPIIDKTSDKPREPSSSLTSTCTSEINEVENVPEITTPTSSTTKSISPILSCSSSASSTVTCTAATTTRNNDDTMKNIDLNLVHSDLSNDIFASLQVPPGCQNMESTSPTAAFLLAFPLVSSIKVTEVIDEDNSDSQRETPTLLQIGSMDSSKPSNNDTLLNLDNFSFFNSKEMCANYYNSKLEGSANESNLAGDKHPEVRSVEPVEGSKSKNDYNYAKDNRQVSSKELVTTNNGVTNDINNFKGNYESFPKSESRDTLGSNTCLDQTTKIFQEPESSQNTHQNLVQDNERYILYEQKPSKNLDNNMYEQSEQNSLKTTSQSSSHELPQVLQDKNNLVTTSGGYDIIQEKLENNCAMLENALNVDYNINHSVICKKAISNLNNCNLAAENINYKNYKGTHVNMGKTINSQEHPANQMFTKDITGGQFNSNSRVTNSPKQFICNKQHNINNFPSNNAKIPEGNNPNLEKSSDVAKMKETYHYNSKQFVQNDRHNVNNFISNSTKIIENQNMDKTTNNINKIETSYHCNSKPFLHNEQQNLTNFQPNTKTVSEGTSTNLEKSDTAKMREMYNYNTKQFLQNEQNLNIFPSNSTKITEGTNHNVVEKSSDVNKMREMYAYNPKQFLPNEQNNVNPFNHNSSKMSEGTGQNLKKSDNTYHYNPKQFIQNEQTINNFSQSSSKLSENATQNSEKQSNVPKTYNYNPFEVVQVPKEMPPNLGDSCNKQINNLDKDKVIDNKRMDEVCNKLLEDKSCYFSTNYATSYRPDTSKISGYENTNKNYSNPFYTNCNYTHNYSDTNFNQNYYKPDGKTCYSLNYENYQEYRKNDQTFTRDRRNSSSKEKIPVQNKPVNWMTTEQKSQTSDCFLPSFPNQSYSFTSCITTDTGDNNFGETKKTADLTDKRFTWSPSKMPNFLEPSHNFITPTLPTLVGDLALGNALPLTDSKTDYKYPKENKRKTYDTQANFLSVSQLVNQNKTESTPARTMSRRLSGSKSKSGTTAKSKRFDKTVDKSPKPANNYSDVFYEQKNRSSTKNVSSNYSAEALIGNQCPQEEKKFPQNPNKLCSSNFLTENIVTYFTSVEDNYMNQNQNFHTYTHNSFQNNSYPSNSFIYTAPAITSSYLTNNFENAPDYCSDGIMNYCGLKDNKNCGSKNYRPANKEDKNVGYVGNVKKTKKANQNNTSLGNFEYPFLPIQGSTSSPILPDDFQSHATFLPPTTPYACKNSLYQKQGNEFNATPLLPLPGITRTSIQHPEVSPSLNPVGTSLTNFNLSTIFPEINKGTIPNVQTNSNKLKNGSNYLNVPFNSEPKYGFTG